MELPTVEKFRRLSRFVLFSKIINFENRQIELIYIRKVAQTKTTKTKTKQKITNSINDSATEVCDEDVDVDDDFRWCVRSFLL